MSNKGFTSLVALLGAVALFFAINIIAGRWLTGARADLTEGKLYTLSNGSKNIAKGLNEPITLTLYLTQKSVNEVPSIGPYSQRVREMLQEYARASEGKIKLRIVDPEPFSENEDKAVQAGVRGLATGRGDERLYFGLAGTNAVDKTEVIPFFDPQKEEFLEFDLAKLIFNLSDQERKPIGLMTWLPIEGSEGNPMTGGRGTPEWQIHKRLKDSFNVKPIATNAKEIPSDIKVLVIVHPKTMSDQTQYAVDQFVMHGGRVVLFVDPNCDTDVPPGMNQFQAMQVPKGSDLEKLMNAWGVEMEPGKVATEADSAVMVPNERGGRQDAVKYIAIMMLDKKHRSASDPVTGQLEQLVLGTVGILKKKDGATTDVQPLIMTSAQSEAVDLSKVTPFPDAPKLFADFKPQGKELWLAVRATGKAKSAFPDGPPNLKTPEGADAGKVPVPATHLAESKDPINVIVVADADFLSDRFWIQEQRLGNMLLGYTEFSDNGAFTVNAIDNLSGSSDLMSLRARGKASRPFTKMKELEDEAQKQYAQKQQELEAKLHETEQQINDIQKQRSDAKETRIVLTPEQRKKMDDFRVQMLQTRKDLRDVRFNLDKDTRKLRAWVMFYNIGLMPIIVGLFAVGLGVYRGMRRTADRQSASKG